MLPFLLRLHSAQTAEEFAKSIAQDPSKIPNAAKFNNCEITNIHNQYAKNIMVNLKANEKKCFYGCYIIGANASFEVNSKSLVIYDNKTSNNYGITVINFEQNTPKMVVVQDGDDNKPVNMLGFRYSTVLSQITCKEDCKLQIIRIDQPGKTETGFSVKTFIAFDKDEANVTSHLDYPNGDAYNLLVINRKKRSLNIKPTVEHRYETYLDGQKHTEENGKPAQYTAAANVFYYTPLATFDQKDNEKTVNGDYKCSVAIGEEVNDTSAEIDFLFKDDGKNILISDSDSYQDADSPPNDPDNKPKAPGLIDSDKQGLTIAISVNACLGVIALVILICICCQCKK